jgi:hypothetical protein
MNATAFQPGEPGFSRVGAPAQAQPPRREFTPEYAPKLWVKFSPLGRGSSFKNLTTDHTENTDFLIEYLTFVRIRPGRCTQRRSSVVKLKTRSSAF